MQLIYNYIPEANHVSMVDSVAAMLQLQFKWRAMSCPTTNILYFYISSFRSKCAVPSVALYCGSLIPFSKYDEQITLDDFEMDLFAPIAVTVCINVIVFILSYYYCHYY
jgi:hypothetical protein